MKNSHRLIVFWMLVITSGLLVIETGTSQLLCRANETMPEKGPSLDPRGEILEFGSILAHHQSYTIEKIKIAHDSQRTVSLNLEVVGLRHEETNFALDPEKWCTLFPLQGSVSRNQPFEFNFKVALPADMPAGIPDGLYQGVLLVKSEQGIQTIRLHFRFTLKLPSFTTVPPDIAENGMEVPVNCCVPGSRKFSLKVLTNADRDQGVRIIAPLILTSEETGASIPSDQAGITIFPEGAHDMDKLIAAGKEPTKMDFQARVNSETIQPGGYIGDITIRADLGRTLYVPVRVVVPASFLVEDIAFYSMIAGLLGILLWLIWPTRRLIQGRNRFQGTRLKITHTSGNVRTPGPWHRILDVQYLPQQNVWQMTAKPGYTLHPSRPDPFLPQGTVHLTKGQGTNIAIQRGHDRYELRIPPISSPMMLNARVFRSPFQRGRILVVWFFWLLLSMACFWSFLHPELWCRYL